MPELGPEKNYCFTIHSLTRPLPEPHRAKPKYMHLVSTFNPLCKSEGNVPVALFVFEDQRRFLRVSEDYEVRLLFFSFFVAFGLFSFF